MSIIKTEHLSYIYSAGTPFEKTAIDSMNIEIEQGEFVGCIGHTGSGKSTLIQHLNGLLKPTSGKVLIDGNDIWADPDGIRKYRFIVGMVFQYPEYQLFEETVYKDIAYGPGNMNLPKEEIDKRVREAVRFVDIPQETLEKSPFELSGGQKRRVAIAGVLAMKPRVLILDEPTAGLDPWGRDHILGQIREYHQEVGNTTILVSHSMEDIARYASKVLLLNRAKVHAYGTVDEIFSGAREIERMGLNIPQITKIFIDLKEKGYNVSDRIYTVKQAKAEMQKLLGGGAGRD